MSETGRPSRAWRLALAVAAAVALYLARHRSLLDELPRLWEALL